MTSSMREGFLRDDTTGALVIAGGGMPDATGQPNGNVLTAQGGTAGWSPPAVAAADLATVTSLIARTDGIVDQDVGGTWPARPTGYGRIIWRTLVAATADKGAFTASTVYAANDVVSNAGSLYSAKIGFTSAASFNATNWNQIPVAALDVVEFDG